MTSKNDVIFFHFKNKFDLSRNRCFFPDKAKEREIIEKLLHVLYQQQVGRRVDNEVCCDFLRERERKKMSKTNDFTMVGIKQDPRLSGGVSVGVWATIFSALADLKDLTNGDQVRQVSEKSIHELSSKSKTKVGLVF